MATEHVADDGTRDFASWLSQALGFPTHIGPDRLTIDLPEDCDDFGTVDVSVTWGESDSTATTDWATLLSWLVERGAAAGLLHAVPAQKPASVADVSASVFTAYTIDGGNVQLAGCTLEDVPVLRVSWLDGERQVKHAFCPAGSAFADVPCDQLGLTHVAPSQNTPRVAPERAQQWLEAARQSAAEVATDLVVAVVWCRFAEGKLSFKIGESSVELPFGGWASLLAEGRSQPPPYHCPLTGQAGHHLAKTDDGQITLATEIEECSETGKRVLAQELETCDVSGRRLLPEFLQSCPVSDARVMADLLQACETCLQAVSPTQLDDGMCAACRSLESVRRDDHRLARVLGTYPQLDRWKKWRLAETADVFIFEAVGLLQRLLLVLDKESLEPLRVANAGRLGSRWTDLTDVQRRECLE